MAAAVTFRSALERIGWSAAAQTAFTDDEGFSEIGELALVTREFLAQTCKKIRTGRPAVIAANGNITVPAILPVTIPALTEYKLYGMHLWVTEMKGQGIEPLATNYVNEVSSVYTKRVRDDLESKNRKEDEIVKLPDPFGWETEWILFYKLLINYLGTKMGSSNVPLEYIVRRNDAPLPADADFTTEHERVVQTTPHSGTTYATDNGKVWPVIKQLTLNGPAFAYIGAFERTRDGRGAIKALVNHYEGESNMSKTKQNAYDDMTNLVYSGERRNFTFEIYVNRHTRAHMVLAEYGEALAESKKVDDFLRGIQDPSTVMLAGKANVWGSPIMRNSFSEVSNYLTNFVQSAPKANSRKIGSLDTGGRGRGRGRFGGRHAGRGRGGRGRSGSGGRGQSTTRNYTNEQWQALSPAQKDEITKARAEKRNSFGNKRSSSAMSTSSPDPSITPPPLPMQGTSLPTLISATNDSLAVMIVPLTSSPPLDVLAPTSRRSPPVLILRLGSNLIPTLIPACWAPLFIFMKAQALIVPSMHTQVIMHRSKFRSHMAARHTIVPTV